LKTVTTRSQLRELVRAWRLSGERIAFVPTMGNLHPGHGDLVSRAKKLAHRVIVSVFVNPMQFGPNEDFAQYPRTPAEDAALLTRLDADALFIPDAADIYPEGYEHSTFVDMPELSTILCGEFRPGHFRGVATVVVKLFHLVAPDVAVFGEKDFQQLTIIRRVVADLCMPIEIVGAPTMREGDGLAMSSRNRYLSPPERLAAPAIFKTLEAARMKLQSGARDFSAVEKTGGEGLIAAGFKLDYFAVRDAANLHAPTSATREFVILAAVRTGKARLIDNVRTSANL
jgi:pantoate--beta-alanine ligase